jgi:hypothetical protein
VLAGLPFPVDRKPSALTPHVLLGKDAETLSNGALIQGDSLLLPAGPDAPEWAIFHFVPAGIPDHVDVVLDAAVTNRTWIGVADYVAERWRFSGPFTDAQSIPLGPNNVSPLGNLFVVVIAEPLFTGKVDQLQLFGWQESPLVDAGPDSGLGCSLAVVNGNPAISYWQLVDTQQQIGQLRYVRATQPDGSAWGTPVIPDTSTNVHGWTSLAVINGNPAICYRDETDWSLHYLRALDADGLAWGSPVTVDPINQTLGARLAVVNGRPAVTYIGQIDFSDAYIEFARAADADGAVWDPPVTIENGINSFSGAPSLVIANGNPALCYEQDISNLRYIRASDPDGAAWGAPQAMGTSASRAMAVIGGHPALMYFSPGPGLVYQRSLDTNGDAWPAPQVIDGSGELAPFGSFDMAEVGGVPAVMFVNQAAGGAENWLKYLQAKDVAGVQWGTPIPLGDQGGSPSWYSLEPLASGAPGVAYCSGSSAQNPVSGVLHFVSRK